MIKTQGTREKIDNLGAKRDIFENFVENILSKNDEILLSF